MLPGHDPLTGDALGNETRQLLYLDRYWDRKELFPNGQCVEFAPFKVGGCSWSICIYLNGASSSSKDYVSLFIALHAGRSFYDPPPPPVVRASTKFSLFDWDGNPVPGHNVDTDLKEYSVPGFGYGFEDFVRREFLEGSEKYLSAKFRLFLISTHLSIPHDV